MLERNANFMEDAMSLNINKEDDTKTTETLAFCSNFLPDKKERDLNHTNYLQNNCTLKRLYQMIFAPHQNHPSETLTMNLKQNSTKDVITYCDKTVKKVTFKISVTTTIHKIFETNSSFRVKQRTKGKV